MSRWSVDCADDRSRWVVTVIPYSCKRNNLSSRLHWIHEKINTCNQETNSRIMRVPFRIFHRNRTLLWRQRFNIPWKTEDFNRDAGYPIEEQDYKMIDRNLRSQSGDSCCLCSNPFAWEPGSLWSCWISCKRSHLCSHGRGRCCHFGRQSRSSRQLKINICLSWRLHYFSFHW